MKIKQEWFYLVQPVAPMLWEFKDATQGVPTSLPSPGGQGNLVCCSTQSGPLRLSTLSWCHCTNLMPIADSDPKGRTIRKLLPPGWPRTGLPELLSEFKWWWTAVWLTVRTKLEWSFLSAIQNSPVKVWRLKNAF